VGLLDRIFVKYLFQSAHYPASLSKRQKFFISIWIQILYQVHLLKIFSPTINGGF
jgi:hypothetical protein